MDNSLDFREIIRKFKGRAIAVYVVDLLLVPFLLSIGIAMGDAEYTPPQWLCIPLAALWYASLFVALYPMVLFVCSPFWFLGQRMLKLTGKLSFSRYLLVSTLGLAAGLLACLFIAVPSPDHENLSKCYESAANAVVPYVNGEDHTAEYEKHRKLVDPLYARGWQLVVFARFVDFFGRCTLLGVLVPPLALYTWELWKERRISRVEK